MNAECRVQNAERHLAAIFFCILHSAFCIPLAASRAEATHAAVASASPYATQIGLRVLQDGGNAADAAKAERKIDPFIGGKIDAGAALVQSDLASTLERIAVNGAREFYDGETARHIVDDGRAAGGVISLRDLREYKPIWRAPLRIAFRGVDIYALAPPSAGGLMIGSMLKILGGLDLPSANAIHLIAEAERRAALDRDKYLGDPSFARVPMRDLLSDERAAQWRASINPKRATPTVTIAEPVGAVAENAHTTHFSVVDAHANVASVT